MDTDIYALVAKYGFKNLHIRLEEIMRDEYAYFQTKFQTPVPNPIIVKELIPEVTIQKKQRKTKVKKIIPAEIVTEEEQSEEVQLSQENTELKDVIVTVTEKVNHFE